MEGNQTTQKKKKAEKFLDYICWPETGLQILGSKQYHWKNVTGRQLVSIPYE